MHPLHQLAGAAVDARQVGVSRVRIGVAVAVAVDRVQIITVEGVTLERSETLRLGKICDSLRGFATQHLAQRHDRESLAGVGVVAQRHPAVPVIDSAGVLQRFRHGMMRPRVGIVPIHSRSVLPWHLLQHSAVAIAVRFALDP